MNKLTAITFLLFVFYTFSLRSQIADQTLLKEEGKEYAYPRISNDGSGILYQSNKEGKWHLYQCDISGSNSRKLTKDTSNSNFPDWSRDNKWISYVSDSDGNEEIYLMSSDGKSVKRLTDSKSRDIHPYFSPDGKYILFNSDRNGSFDIYRLTLASGQVEQLTETPENETCARYSPDMKQIVFLKNDRYSDDVFVMDVKSGITNNVTQSAKITDGWPMFDETGKWIYFSTRDSGAYAIYKIKTDGTEKTQLTFPAKDEEDARVCIARSGRFMIYNKKIGKTISVLKMDLSS